MLRLFLIYFISLMPHFYNLVEQFKTKYQKHHANDADELERYGFFKKSKARVTKHDDQSREHHHEGANLDQSCDNQTLTLGCTKNVSLHFKMNPVCT